jgi:predicted nucleic acid-binding protein
MILIDANVLVGLCDPGDALFPAALRDLQRLRREAMVVTTSVLVESFALLPRPDQRARLVRLVQGIPLSAPERVSEQDVRGAVFAWLARYADHEPDYADAELAVLSGMNARWRVWSYDEEFSTIWRRPDGTRIPLAVRW